MKIWFISDTHGNHDKLEIPEGIDLVVHSGDATNYWDVYRNEPEFFSFLDWYDNLKIPNKIFVPGNHDSFIYKYEKQCRNLFSMRNIIMLVGEYVDVEGLKICGNPMTPTFGNWFYMTDRAKIYKHWELIPTDTDILVTHGPPKHILDLSHDAIGRLEHCGDSSLFKKVLEIKPKIHCFGHIHNSNGCYNQGERIYEGINFINASCVTDCKMGKITSHGIIKEI